MTVSSAAQKSRLHDRGLYGELPHPWVFRRRDWDEETGHEFAVDILA